MRQVTAVSEFKSVDVVQVGDYKLLFFVIGYGIVFAAYDKHGAVYLVEARNKVLVIVVYYGLPRAETDIRICEWAGVFFSAVRINQRFIKICPVSALRHEAFFCVFGHVV